MRNHFVRLSALTVLLVSLTSAAVAQSETRYAELPNFQMVNERLYRGAQPQSGGFRRLAELGIRTVVNLRGADGRARTDEARAHAAGLRFFNVPMAGHARPTDKQVERVLSIINVPENQPVFLYCRRGADRTGTMTAVYRISQDGWTSESAIAEANRRGMFLTQFEMKDYIRDYYCRHTGAHETCENRRLFDRVGTSAATVTRRIVEEARRHSFTQRGVRQIKRFIL